MKGRALLAGLGAGILFTLPYTSPLLSPDHLLIYHSQRSVRSVAAALLIDVTVLGVVGALAALYLEKPRNRDRHPAWIAIGVCVALIAVVLVTEAFQWPDYHRYLIRAAAVSLTLGIVCRWRWPRLYRGYAHALMALFLLAGLSAIWIVPEFGWLVFAQPHASAGSAASPAAGTARERIVWVLFDELSYDQTFDHRYPGIAMPAFDQLAKSSVVFSDLMPAAYYTELAVPSLFLGSAVTGLKSNMEGVPRLRFAGVKGWRQFDPAATVFGDAQRQGWSTGVAGWYNPYCRTMASVLDSCYAASANLDPGAMSAENSVVQNALLPVEDKLGKFVPIRKPMALARAHRRDYIDVMGHATALLRDENIRFVFIHLPIPHPPGIYDAKSGRLRAGGDYLDNLALSDRTLGEILAILSQTASRNRTTLIVCSDHSWRVPMWRQWAGWTPREQAASKGVFDPRPVLMIHFAGETEGMMVGAPFEEVRLHEILQQMIAGSMHTRAAFAQWLDRSQAPDEDRPSSQALASR